MVLVAGCGGVRWDYDDGFGRKRAESEGKPLLLYFTDVMSTDHRNLQRAVFDNADVQREMAAAVNVMLSWQYGSPPRRYRIASPQVLIMCRPDGTEVDRFHAKPVPLPMDFIAWLLRARPAAAAPSPGR